MLELKLPANDHSRVDPDSILYVFGGVRLIAVLAEDKAVVLFVRFPPSSFGWEESDWPLLRSERPECSRVLEALKALCAEMLVEGPFNFGPKRSTVCFLSERFTPEALIEDILDRATPVHESLRMELVT